MNYLHAYHAGNFADVFKHALLSLLLQNLRQKDKGFCYIDAYAGSGLYDLQSPEALTGGESQGGIGRLWQTTDAPAGLDGLLHSLRQLNADPAIPPRWYPGSPELARSLLRPQDRMVLLELHPPVFEALQQNYQHAARAQVRQSDAWDGLRALLPPLERRGLVLIDPPFERADEFTQIRKGLQMALKQWASGVYAVWYPVKQRSSIAHFHRSLQNMGVRKIYAAELLLYPDDNKLGLNGCGMVVINPPWEFPQQAEQLLPWLSQRLAVGPFNRWHSTWLVPE